jgi:hypothetical protein
VGHGLLDPSARDLYAAATGGLCANVHDVAILSHVSESISYHWLSVSDEAACVWKD